MIILKWKLIWLMRRDNLLNFLILYKRDIIGHEAGETEVLDQAFKKFRSSETVSSLLYHKAS